jgi:hypothetical protein
MSNELFTQIRTSLQEARSELSKFDAALARLEKLFARDGYYETSSYLGEMRR